MAQIKPLVSLLPIILIMLMVQLHPPLSHSCPEYQKQALLRFKHLLLQNTSASHYLLEYLIAWNSTIDCCDWDSIICKSQHVTQLFLDPYEYQLFRDPNKYVTQGVVSLGASNVLTPLFHIQTLTFLHITNMGLEGKFPPEIANLTELESLDLSYNKLSGSIPYSLGHLRKLSDLNLGYNSLSMKIPAEFGNLTILESLDLRNNKLSGSIPSSLCRLRKLTDLNLDANSLSSEIPIEFGNLTNIVTLTLGDNDLSGQIPPWIQDLGKLNSLDLEDNLLIGEIPKRIFHLRNLEELKLGGNLLVRKKTITSISPNSQIASLSLRSCSISGHIPVWLSNYTSLAYLDLSNNSLTGTFPKWLLSTKFTSLILSNNNFSGSVSPLLFKENLHYLDLSNNNFSGSLPDNIGEASLETLVLSGNDFSGPIPKSISLMPLKVLDLSKNRLSGNKFPKLQSLYVLDLSFNLFFGEIPVMFSPQMILLVLCNNEFSGFLPPTLASLSNLSYFDLHDNKLTGEIPSFLFQISTLQILDLSNNYFQGHMPNNISNLTHLHIVDVSGNKLRGKVPANLAKLSGMIAYNHELKYSLRFDHTIYSFSNNFYNKYVYYNYIQIKYPDLQVFWKESKRNLPNQHLGLYTFLDLSNNQLFGKIPDTLGALRNLKVLNFSHNKLSGRIPSTINGLENLESLDLSYNNLSGEIPETIGKLLQLSTLELSDNELTGRIPTGPQMDRLNDPESYANNNGLCGTQIRVPCDKPLPNENGKESDAESMEDWWFSWKMAAIGFPSGFLSTVLVLYNIGYFRILSKRQLRRQGRRRQYIMPCF